MSTVMLEEVSMAKSGKSLRVRLGGSMYGAYLDSGLNNPALKGSFIVAEIVTLEKGGPWVKAWKPSVVPVAAPVTTPAPTGFPVPSPVETTRQREPEYAKPAAPGNVAPYWLQFASNTIAHAIAAGLIKSANDVGTWVRAVEMSLKTDDLDPPF